MLDLLTLLLPNNSRSCDGFELNCRIVPATGWGAFLSFYDPLVSVFTRQAFCQKHIVEQVQKIALPSARKPIRILDVGCGTGTLAIALTARNHALRQAMEVQSVQVQGLDADPRILAQAERKHSTAASIEWILGNATDLPQSNASIDITVCSLVFHHLTEAEKARSLVEIFRVLVPGGTLILLDYGLPQSKLAGCQFLAVRMIDGFARTRCNVQGKLPGLIQSAGFNSPAETLVSQSLLGTIRCYRASKPNQHSHSHYT